MINESDWKSRTELLVGPEGIQRLKDARVLVVGLGGVGGIAAEQMCRAGIGHITLVDSDTVQASNINRQIIALRSTVGREKTTVLAERLKDINPEARITVKKIFLEGNLTTSVLDEGYDYIIDAIDTLTPKVELLEACISRTIPVISSMGSGARLDPTKIFIDDIKNSHDCKFAYLVRKYLHKRGIYDGIKVVYSTEKVPKQAMMETDGANFKRTIVGTISYMPAIFGGFCASVAIRDILNT